MPTIEELRQWLMGNTDGGGDLPSREKWDGNPRRDLLQTMNKHSEQLDQDDDSTVGGKLSIDKMMKKRHPKDVSVAGRKIKVSIEGDDAMLSFGKHKGSSISDLVKNEDGRSYLRWMLKQDFNDELLEIVRHHIDAWVRSGKLR